MVGARGGLVPQKAPSPAGALQAGARRVPLGRAVGGLCWGLGGLAGGRPWGAGLQVGERGPCVRPQTCRGAARSRGRSPDSACPASGPPRAGAGPPSSRLAALQDPHLRAGWDPRCPLCGVPGTSIKKLTRGLASVSRPAPSSWQPRGLSHRPLLLRGQACGLGRSQPLWTQPGPSGMGLLAPSWPGGADRLDVSLPGARAGLDLCKPHRLLAPTPLVGSPSRSVTLTFEVKASWAPVGRVPGVQQGRARHRPARPRVRGPRSRRAGLREQSFLAAQTCVLGSASPGPWTAVSLPPRAQPPSLAWRVTAVSSCGVCSHRGAHHGGPALGTLGNSEAWTLPTRRQGPPGGRAHPAAGPRRYRGDGSPWLNVLGPPALSSVLTGCGGLRWGLGNRSQDVT